jgi:hypothetical protein
MKTKEYIKKYELNKNDKFNHKEFISDLTFDFITLLEVGKAKENIKGFENAVRAIRMKWDSINNKTIGQLPEKLWKYFFATVIAKMREQLFPELIKARKEESEQRKRIREERKRNDEAWDNFFFFSLMSDLFSQRKPVSSFQTLGVSLDCTKEEVQSAYRTLSKKHHPDMGGKHDKFIEITEAKNKCLAYLN